MVENKGLQPAKVPLQDHPLLGWQPWDGKEQEHSIEWTAAGCEKEEYVDEVQTSYQEEVDEGVKGVIDQASDGLIEDQVARQPHAHMIMLGVVEELLNNNWSTNGREVIGVRGFADQ